MPESADQLTKPPRTWRPMALWTVGILLTLGLVWFIGAVAVPVWQVRAIVKPAVNVHGDGGWTAADIYRWGGIEQLGGPEAARRKLILYLRMPGTLAPGRLTAALLFEYCGEQAMPEMLAFHAGSRDAERRAMAMAMAFARFDDPRVVEPLVELLETGDAGRPGLVYPIRRLGEIGDPRALEPLLGLLARHRTGAPECFHEIAGALGSFRDPRVIRPVLDILSREKDRSYSLGIHGPGARESIQKLLGPELAGLAIHGYYGFDQNPVPPEENLRDPLVFEFLLALLERKSSGRADAALLLGASGDARALGPLLAALGDKSWKQRFEAAYALGGLADPGATEALAACLGEQDEQLRAAAACALGAIGPKAAGAVGALQRASNNEAENVRTAVAEALKKIRGEEDGR